MATEPTLGGRILDAANAYAAAISEQVVALDRGTWEVAHADAVTEAMDRLRAPAARANAAERLAVAVGDADLRGLPCVHLGMARKGRVGVDEGEWRRLNVAVGSIAEALAAWRALGGVDE